MNQSAEDHYMTPPDEVEQTAQEKLDAEIAYYRPKLERAVNYAFSLHPDDAQARWHYIRNNWLDEAVKDFDKYADTRDGLAAMVAANLTGEKWDMDNALGDFLGDLVV